MSDSTPTLERMCRAMEEADNAGSANRLPWQDYEHLACAALDASGNELVEALNAARELIMQANWEEGYCMCGSKVEDHGMGDGHSPVDAGSYHMQQVVDKIDAAIARTQEQSDG